MFKIYLIIYADAGNVSLRINSETLRFADLFFFTFPFLGNQLGQQLFTRFNTFQLQANARQGGILITCNEMMNLKCL